MSVSANMMVVLMMHMLVSSSAAAPTSAAPTTATTATTTTAGRCVWGNATVGSIQGRNLAFFTHKQGQQATLEACKTACDAEKGCASIDFSATNGCFIGNCRIGKECSNSGDTDFTYYACGEDPYWLDIQSMDKIKVSQINTAHGGSADRAVDGNSAPSWHSRSVTHTHTTNNPWWKLDLGAKLDVTDVKVTNRGDCCGHYLNGFNVLVDDKECAKNVHISQGETVHVPCKGNGQNIKIVVPRRSHLMIAEVQVGVDAAYATTFTTTIAPIWVTPSADWVATQVNSAHGGDAKRAIDGNLGPSWHSRSVTHTHNTNNPWWKVDLKQQVNLSAVQVINRGDCCGDRLNGFDVYAGVSDDSLKKCASDVQIRQGQAKNVKCEGMASIVKIQVPRHSVLSLAEVRIGLPGKPVVEVPPSAAAIVVAAPAVKKPSTTCTSSAGVCEKGTFKFMVQAASEAACKTHCDAGRDMAKEGGVLEEVYKFRQHGQFSDLEGKKPDLSRKVSNVNYPGTGSPWKGFGSLRDQFYVHWSGFIVIKTPGTYTFTTSSDDGSRLFLNGAQVVDNPGWHGMRHKEGKELLEAGKHEFWSEMFEGGGGAGMEMYYSGPDTGNSKVIMPQSAFAPPAGKGGNGELVIVSDVWKAGICQAYSYEAAQGANEAGSCLLYSKCDGVSKDVDDVCGDKTISGNSGGLMGQSLHGFNTCVYGNDGNSTDAVGDEKSVGGESSDDDSTATATF